MAIALLSCGESAIEHWSDERASEYSCVVGVNWAGLVFSLDWLAAWDGLVWYGLELKAPSVGGFGFNASAMYPALEYEPFEHWIRSADGVECTLTFPHALLHCLAKWPEERIDVYGLDFDKSVGLQREGRVDRSSSRWGREAAFCREIFNGLEGARERVRLIGCRVSESTLINSVN